MLTNAFRALVNNPFKKVLIEKKKKLRAVWVRKKNAHSSLITL